MTDPFRNMAATLRGKRSRAEPRQGVYAEALRLLKGLRVGATCALPCGKSRITDLRKATGMNLITVEGTHTSLTVKRLAKSVPIYRGVKTKDLR